MAGGLRLRPRHEGPEPPACLGGPKPLGRLAITLVPRDGSGPSQSIERRYLEVWRKDAGRWRVVRTMDNAP